VKVPALEGKNSKFEILVICGFAVAEIRLPLVGLRKIAGLHGHSQAAAWKQCLGNITPLQWLMNLSAWSLNQI